MLPTTRSGASSVCSHQRSVVRARCSWGGPAQALALKLLGGEARRSGRVRGREVRGVASVEVRDGGGEVLARGQQPQPVGGELAVGLHGLAADRRPASIACGVTG
jgi:hypothetical protein